TRHPELGPAPVAPDNLAAPNDQSYDAQMEREGPPAREIIDDTSGYASMLADRMKARLSNEPTGPTSDQQIINGVDQAWQRIKERHGGLLDVTEALVRGAADLKDLTIIGAANIYRGFKKVADWNAEMKKFIPNASDKELRLAREKAEAFVDRQMQSKGGANIGKKIPELVELIDQGFVSPDWYAEVLPMSVKMFPGGEADASIFWA